MQPITIRYDRISREIRDLHHNSPIGHISLDRSVINVHGVAYYLIEHGRDIIVEPYDGADAEVVRYTTSRAITYLALAMQGLLPLRASGVVDTDGEAILMMAPPLNCKSRVAQQLTELGYTPYCDDMVYLVLHGDQLCAVTLDDAFYIPLSKKQLSDPHQIMCKAKHKYEYPVHDPVPVKKIILIRTDRRQAAPITITPSSNIAQTCDFLERCYHHSHALLQILEQKGTMFRQSMDMIRHLSIHHLSKNDSDLSSRDIAHVIHQNISHGYR